MKFFLLFYLTSAILFSKVFEFSEIRYSDAFESFRTLQGVISFEKNSLEVKYQYENKEIFYENSHVVIKEDGEMLPLESMQEQRVASFFKILLLLYHGDASEIDKYFRVENVNDKTTLVPKNEIGQYIENISLVRQKEELKEVKISLKNLDSITIRIEDEIR